MPRWAVRSAARPSDKSPQRDCHCESHRDEAIHEHWQPPPAGPLWIATVGYASFAMTNRGAQRPPYPSTASDLPRHPHISVERFLVFARGFLVFAGASREVDQAEGLTAASR